MKVYHIYIISNNKNTILYIGVTSKLKQRIIAYKEGRGSKFTRKYKIHKLIYFEEFTDIRYAIEREKQLKNWHRDWKENLIKTKNPEYRDLFWDIVSS